MRAAIDSNVMIYAESLSDDPRCQMARNIVAVVDINVVVIPAQALAETAHWLLKKAGRSRSEAAESASYWRGMFRVEATTDAVLAAAFEVMEKHKLQVFDAIILASAAEAGADVLLSEDMQHGFHWRGVTIVNPFHAERHPLLKTLISPQE
jgi:predicted nucleic acid-binding protein